jgi:hypothetical protein
MLSQQTARGAPPEGLPPRRMVFCQEFLPRPPRPQQFLWAVVMVMGGGTSTGAGEQPPAPTTHPFLSVAYLHSGTLYHLHPVIDRRIREFYRRGELLEVQMWQAPLTPGGAIAGKAKYWTSDAAQFGTPYHWRICQGRFWGTGDSMECGQCGFYRCNLDQLTALHNKSYFLDPLIGLHEYHCRAREARDKGRPWEEGYFDFLPGTDDTLDVLLAWRGEMRLWRGRMRPDDQRRYPIVDWQRTIEPRTRDEEEEVDRLRKEDPSGPAWAPIACRPVLRLCCELREPFQTFQDADHYFLASVSGELHVLHKLAERPRLWKVWSDPQRPIAALLTDTATGKTFAFTASRGDGRTAEPDVYFELSGKPKPVPYDRARVPADDDDDPLPHLIGFARVLLRDGKVVVKK